MTRKWALQVPASVVSKELSYNRDNLLTAFDKIFDDAFRGVNGDLYKSFGIDPFSKTAYPKVNVVAYDDRVTIEAEIAGYSKKEIEVQVEEGLLSITGKTSSKNDTGETDDIFTGTHILRELKRGSFSRSFRLSDELDTDNIEATFKDGILMINIPRREPVVNKINKVTIR
jgi:HSP20 family protein